MERDQQADEHRKLVHMVSHLQQQQNRMIGMTRLSIRTQRNCMRAMRGGATVRGRGGQMNHGRRPYGHRFFGRNNQPSQWHPMTTANQRQGYARVAPEQRQSSAQLVRADGLPPQRGNLAETIRRRQVRYHQGGCLLINITVKIYLGGWSTEFSWTS